jgi:heme/copper-type cytochrome/quinol oxidase subunit 2
LVLKRVVNLPSRALAGALALLVGALVLATQPARSRALPLAGAVQLEPATAVVVVVVGVVVVVVGVVVVVVVVAVVVVAAPAEGAEIVEVMNPATTAIVASTAVPGTACRLRRPCRL